MHMDDRSHGLGGRDPAVVPALPADERDWVESQEARRFKAPPMTRFICLFAVSQDALHGGEVREICACLA